MHSDTYSKQLQNAGATAEQMAGTALLALLERVARMAAMAGRALVGLRVVFLGVGSENVWGLRRAAGTRQDGFDNLGN